VKIHEYNRPQSIEEALRLLARDEPVTVPLAGGSALNRPGGETVAAVDLQALGLDGSEARGHRLILGATLTLQVALGLPEIQPALRQAIRHEAAYNLRQVATVAGTLVAADGRSPFTTALLALDASVSWLEPSGDKPEGTTGEIDLGELLPLRKERLRKRLVTQVSLPLNARLAYEYVARTPADRPIVCGAVAVWPSGRTRVALGGYGSAPVLALDGPEAGGADSAARNAYSGAGDEWASSEYRQEAAATLVARCLSALQPD
jgi:CO/xanthine dehydrogenase FAD-binding subunit